MKKKALKLGVVAITVTPENIDEHLRKCKSNRARQRKHVQTWVRAIRKGHFRDGGFIFADENGDYDDGQHRLAACKITKHTATFHVATGLDRESLNMMLDGGKKRTNSDRMRNLNVKYASQICTAIEEIVDIKERWRRTTLMLLADEVMGFYQSHSEELDALAVAYHNYEDIPERFMIAFNFLFARIDADKCDKFFKDLTHRQLVKPGNPVYAFYQMLQSEDVVNTTNHQQVNRYIRNGLIRAWNACFKGEQLQSMEPTERWITLEGTAVISAAEERENGDLFEDVSNGEPGSEIDVESEAEEEADEAVEGASI